MCGGEPSSANGAGKNWIPTCRKKNLNLYLSPLTKIKSRWIKDLNLRPQTIKLLLENTGETLGNTGVGKDFLNKTPKAQSIIPKIGKWDYIRLRSFCMAKDTVISVN